MQAQRDFGIAAETGRCSSERREKAEETWTEWIQTESAKQNTRETQQRGTQPRKCGNCGGPYHPRRELCPAYGKKCHACQKLHHFKSVCRSKDNPTTPQNQAMVHEIEVQDYSLPTTEEYSEQRLFIGQLTIDGIHLSPWTETLEIQGKPITFKLDTGSEADILTLSQFNNLQNLELSPPTVNLVSYSGHRLTPHGVTTINIKGHDVKFQVIEEGDPILGRDTCEKLNLIQRINSLTAKHEQGNNLMEEYKDVFSGLGCISKNYHLFTNPNVEPSVDPPRRIPYAIRDQVKEELDRMVDTGVIVRHYEPTPWVNSMTIVKKPNKVRICIDPTKLNKAIQRAHHPVKTVEEIAADMPNSTVFSTLDANSGYWQIELDEESSKLCTFNTPWGRYRFTRLPFGISTSGDIFNQVMQDLFHDLEGVNMVVDDIMVHAATREEHDHRLRQVLERAQAVGLKLNSKKSKIAMSQVEYVGHIISSDGLKPSPERTRAILDMPTPQCKEDVQRFIAMVGSLQKFIPNLSEETKPLRELLVREIAWHWEERHQEAYQRLKNLVTNAPVLKFYDKNAPVSMHVDASKSGLGAVLIQDNHPVAYGSKALDSTQSRYAVIEKELLAMCFGCKKFHEYIFGKPVTIETDHKPLLAIMSKPIHTLSARMQRMRMRLQRYDIQVKYRRGKNMLLADTLSRAFLDETQPEDLFDDEIEVNSIQMSDNKLSEYKEATAKDSSLIMLKDAVLNGWPHSLQLTPSAIKPYYTFRDEITYVDGLCFKGNKIIIPETLRPEVLNCIHEAQLGIVKSIRLARDTVFWPNMQAHIEDMITQCSVCQRNRKLPPAEPMIPHSIPARPWAKVATDLFHFQGREYLLCVDYYSKYPDLCLLPDTSSSSVISALKAIFSRFGIPDECISDNGPQYASREFRSFADTWEFKHVTISPGYSQSNGQIERTVQTIKNLMKKCEMSGDDPSLAILNYRNTPIDGIGESPAQLLMSRRLRGRLPINSELLKPKVPRAVRTKLTQRQETQKTYYNARASGTLPQLKAGDKIRFKNHKGEWQLGTITGRMQNRPRSYWLSTPDGRTFRRNRRHLFATCEPVPVYTQQPNRVLADTTYRSDGHTQAITGSSTTSSVPESPPMTIASPNPIVQSPRKSTGDTLPSASQSPVVVPSPDTATKCASPTKPHVYVTRSGRASKPKERMDL